MSDSKKPTGAAFGSTLIKGEKAPDFEELVAPEAEAEVEEVAEAAVEEVVAEEASPEVPEETEAERLVRETTERLVAEAAEQAEPPPTDSVELAEMRGRLSELKDQITQMGRAQEVPEPEEGYDLSLLKELEDPAVVEMFDEAKDDPKALARMTGVIVQKVLEANQGREASGVKKELEDLKQAIQQTAQRQQHRQVFERGLEAAASMGEVEAALVSQFHKSNELASLDAHIRQHGQTAESLKSYKAKSILGAFLTQSPENLVFAATPGTMQAGMSYLVRMIGAQGSPEAASISKTGAAVPAKGGGITDTKGETATPEDEILAGILSAAKERRTRGGAFARS